MTTDTHDVSARYQTALALWAVVHKTDHHDFTREQRTRFVEHTRLLNAGLDVERIEFARHLARTGQIGEGQP